MRLAGVLGMVVGPLLLLVCINLVKLGIFRRWRPTYAWRCGM